MALWDMQEVKERWAGECMGEGAPDMLKKKSKGESRVRSPGENGGVIQVCEGGIGKTKGHLDLNLVEDLEGNNKTCCVSAWGGGKPGAAAAGAGQLDKGQVPNTTFTWAGLDTAKGAEI